MKEKEMTAKDSLEIITKMVENRKKNWRDSGHILRFWGWLVLIASTGHYILSLCKLHEFIWLAWSLTIFGAIYTVIYFARLHKNKGERDFLDKVSGFIWWLFAINAFIFGFGFTIMWGHLTTGLILIILGIAAAIDGKIMRFRPMIVGGILTNLLGIFCIFWVMMLYKGTVTSQNFLILLIGAGISLTNIIPGYILRNQYKKTKSDTHG